MKKILSMLLFTFSIVTFAQNDYYYYKGKKQAIVLETNKVNIFTTVAFNPNQITNLYPLSYKQKNQNWGTVEFNEPLNETQYYQKINQLKNTENIISVGLFYKAKNNTSVGTSDIFYVQLKNQEQYTKLETEALKKNVIIARQVANSLWYCMQLTNKTTETSVELSNYFYEVGFANVDPSFILPIANIDVENSNSISTTPTVLTGCSNDPEFNMQWGLNNNSYPTSDINACQAWTIATGTGSKVAVLDTGIKINHSDIIANIYTESYDTETLTQPSQLTQNPNYVPGYYSNHGTHVAGIIGAKGNNGIEISGVAPNCTIIGISNSLSEDNVNNQAERLGYGIFWAKTEEADIINCSWHYNVTDNYATGEPFSTALLEYFILEFIELGREGKGGIIVFAAGNIGVGGINYPANFDERILTIGATNTAAQRASFSSYNTTTTNNRTIDVVAPGVDINSLIVNILPASSPSEGTLIVDPDDSIDQSISSGTSMAAPHVSGVAALILSINPCLSGQQVRDIIEQTAQKAGGYSYVSTAGRPNGTWNNEMGYGLLDANEAVIKAQLLGGDNLYIKDNTADLGIEPNTATIVWNSPDIWLRNQPDGGTIHQNAITGTNYVYVKIRNKGCIATNPNDYVKLYQTVNTWGCILQPIVDLGTQTIPSITSGQDTILMFPVQLIFNRGMNQILKVL